MEPETSIAKPIGQHKWLFFAGVIALFCGISGAFYDLTYHIKNVVDTFFQPDHLLIYSNIFGSVLAGIALYVKTRFKSLMIFGSLILAFGFVDLFWHNHFGFNSFPSPPHLLLISATIPFYIVASFIGGIRPTVTYKILKPDFMIQKILLRSTRKHT